jgi:hypothetical protein
MQLHKVDGYERGPVIVMHIPKSWLSPHMVSFGQTHFYSRNSSGVHPLDVREIGQAFRYGAERAQQIRQFRDGRVATVMAAQTPVPIWGNETKLIIHACPLEPYAAEEAKDFGNPGRMPPILRGSGWNSRHNLDGFVTYSGADAQPKRSYALAFRDGTFEGVCVVDRHPEKGWIYGQRLERTISNSVGLFSDLTRERGYEGPLSVMVALIDAYGARLIWDEYSQNAFDEDHRIDRAALLLPDIFLADGSADVERALAPLIDALWQSSGWASRPG